MGWVLMKESSITARVDPVTKERLVALAEAGLTTVSRLVAEAVRQYLDGREDPRPPTDRRATPEADVDRAPKDRVTAPCAMTKEGYTLRSLLEAGWTLQQACEAYPELCGDATALVPDPPSASI